MPAKIEISPKTILIISSLVIGVWLLGQIRDILFLLFISFIIMASLRPVVDRLVRLKVPRILAILLIYVLLIVLVGVYGTFIIPPLVYETVRFINNIPQYLEPITPYISIDFNTVVQQIAPLGQNVARATLGLFSNILAVFAVIVFSFYLLLERDSLSKALEVLVGKSLANRINRVLDKSESRMGAWVRGQLILALVIGQMTFIGLTLLKVNFALPLSLIAGVLEIVPIIGPNIAAIPAILVALTMSPGHVLVIILLYLVIQQLENNFIVPIVMKKTVGMTPLISLLALMIGGRLGGILGVVLSIPTLLVAQTIIQELFWRRK